MTNDTSVSSERAKLVAGIGRERAIYYKEAWTRNAGTMLFKPHLYEHIDAVRNALKGCNSVTLYSIKSEPDTSWFLVGTKYAQPNTYFEVAGFESSFSLKMLMDEGQSTTALKHFLRSARAGDITGLLLGVIIFAFAFTFIADMGMSPPLAGNLLFYGVVALVGLGFGGLLIQSRYLAMRFRAMARALPTVRPEHI